MNFFSSLTLRTSASAALVAWGAGLTSYAAGEEPIQFNGVGWVQYGIIAKSTDTLNNNFNGNSIQSSGAQITLKTKPSEQFEVIAGLGVFEGHSPAGTIEGGGRVRMSVGPYIAQASFTYSWLNEEERAFRLTGGLFPYNYSQDVKNLGLYLLRGPVYPGIVISGFETKHVLPIANMLGARLQHQSGGFEQNLIINSETELYPYFDLSPAYLASYRFGSIFQVGAGVNFYRLIPIDNKVTTPFLKDRETEASRVTHAYDRNYVYVDSTPAAGGAFNYDTTFLTFKGTKVMANFSLDPKPIFGGSKALGREDLKMYGEVAVLGLNNSKAYRTIYGEIKDRMPIMVGFNIPTFHILDHFSLEFERYTAPYRDDLTRYISGSLAKPASPLPVSNGYLLRDNATLAANPWADVQQNQTKDNLKWSLHGAKVIQNHFRVSFQVASDHFRPGSVSGKSDPSGEAALTSLSDWYWMSKIAYFF